MPWKVETLMSAREEFIALALTDRTNMSELCQRMGISRKTGYKMLRRYAESGADGLQDRSHRTSQEMEERIIALRLAHPGKGAHVLHRMLQNQRVTNVPAKSTISAILKRHGLIDPAESAEHTPQVRFEYPAPNALWQLDLIGVFRYRHHRHASSAKQRLVDDGVLAFPGEAWELPDQNLLERGLGQSGLVDALVHDHISVLACVVSQRPKLSGHRKVHVLTVAGDPGVEGHWCGLGSFTHLRIIQSAPGMVTSCVPFT